MTEGAGSKPALTFLPILRPQPSHRRHPQLVGAARVEMSCSPHSGLPWGLRRESLINAGVREEKKGDSLPVPCSQWWSPRTNLALLPKAPSHREEGGALPALRGAHSGPHGRSWKRPQAEKTRAQRACYSAAHLVWKHSRLCYGASRWRRR